MFTPDNDEKEAVASTRLALPGDAARSAIDSRYALLMLHFEPPAHAANEIAPVGPVASTDHIRRALELPNALNSLLAEQLNLKTHAEPPVVLGLRLETPHDLAELFDITGLTTLPGGQRDREAIGYFISDRTGAPGNEAVDRMIRDSPSIRAAN